MKYTTLFVCVLIAVVSAEDVIKYAGSTEGVLFSNTWKIPINTNGVCAADSSSTKAPYQKFSVTFATAGVREVAVMAERDFKSYIRVYIYETKFDENQPCTGLLGGDSIQKQFSATGGPILDDFIQFSASTYVFVVSGTSSDGGLFSVNIFPSAATGLLAAGGNSTWTPILSYSSSCSSDQDQPTPYGSYTWTQATTGVFDVYALFNNKSVAKSDFYSYLSLYEGTPLAGGLSVDPCNDTETNATLIYAARSTGSLGVFIAYTNLTAGTTYSVVFSSDDGITAYWGVQVIPTRIRWFHPNGYTQPSRAATLCSASSNTNSAWDSTVFVAEHSTYLIDTANPPSNFDSIDTYSFLYKGQNDANPPGTCPLTQFLVSDGDTGDVTPVYATTIKGTTYTVVVSSFGGGGVSDPTAYVLYLFTGTDFDTANSSEGVVSSVAVSSLATLLVVLVLGAFL